MTHPDHMTGAELQTLREAAGLTREVLAGLVDVQARTVKHWETRTGAAVPADVAAIVSQAAAWVAKASREGLQAAAALYGNARAQNAIAKMLPPDKAPPPCDESTQVVLIRYRETEHLHPSDRASCLRADVHGAMVARLVLDLSVHGMRPRVVWFDPAGFGAWLLMQGHTLRDDTPATRAAWAAEAIDRQAIPHPGDQPPASHTPGH